MEKQLELKSYKKPTLLNRIMTIMVWMWLVLNIVLILLQKFNINTSTYIWLLFIILFFVGFIATLIGLFSGSIFETTQLYKIDGVILLKKNMIVIDNKEFLIENISTIHFYCHNVKNVAYGKGGISDGSNNNIEIKIDNQFFKRRFIIESTEQRDELKKYILHLKCIDSNIYVDGIDLK